MALGLRSLYMRRLLSLPQYIVCPSRYVASYFTDFAGVDPKRVRVVPNGIALPPATDAAHTASDVPIPTPRQRGSLNLAFLGSVVRHKGVHVILDALKIARLPRVRLELHGPLGDPGYATELQAAAAHIRGLTLNLSGPYDPHQLNDLLRDADCLIAPSQWPETFLLVSREALARGVPVIVSRLGALPDSVTENLNGFSFDHDDPQQLAGLLGRLAEDDELVYRLRDGARRSRVRSVEEHAEEIRGVYAQGIRDLADGSGGVGLRANLEELGFLHAALHEVETSDRGGLPQRFTAHTRCVTC